MKFFSFKKIVLFFMIISFLAIGQISIINAATCPGNGCETGETIFNCPDDCLDSGIPRKLFGDILDDTITFVLGLGLMLAIIFLIWSGTIYVSSSGDAQKAENAKKTMKYAILGIIVIAISFALIKTLSTLFTP